MTKKLTKRTRVYRDYYGAVLRVSPRETGALAQCRFCQWGNFVRDNSRKHFSAMARAAASLRAHTRLEHPDKLPKLTDPATL